MIRAKNYETVSKFVKVTTKILWPLFFRTQCRCWIISWQLQLSGTKQTMKVNALKTFKIHIDMMKTS